MDCQHRVGAGGKVSGTHPGASTSHWGHDAMNTEYGGHGVRNLLCEWFVGKATDQGCRCLGGVIAQRKAPQNTAHPLIRPRHDRNTIRYPLVPTQRNLEL